MPNPVFDDLPPEIKLHIFSFLSLSDIAHVFSINKLNHEIDQDAQYWRILSKHNFYTSVPEGYRSKLFYQKTHHQLIQERRLFVAYLASCRQIANETEEVKHDHYAMIGNALEHLEMDGFFSVANQKVDDFDSDVNKLFRKMILSGKYQTKLVCEVAMRENLYPAQGDLSASRMASVGFALDVLAKCNASVSLTILFNHLAVDERNAVLDKFGSSMLCSAVLFGREKVAELLLGLGVNVNNYSLYTRDEFTLGALPIFYIYSLLVKAHRATNKGENIKNIINLLIKFGADMDLPGVKSIDPHVGDMILPESHRSQMKLHLQLMRKPDPAMRELLQIMISAPVYHQHDRVEENPNDQLILR